MNVDLATAKQLHREFERLIGSGFARVGISLRGAEFIGSTGLHALRAAHAPAQLDEWEREVIPELRAVPHIMKVGLFEVGLYCVNLGDYFVYVSPAGEALLGCNAGELLDRHADGDSHRSRPDGSSFLCGEWSVYRALLRARRGRRNEVFWRRDGSALYFAHSTAPVYEKEPVGALVAFADEGERRRDDELLQTRAAQQAALAEFGLRALGGGALQEVLQHASALVATMLNAQFSGVLKLVDEEQRLRLVAGVGWRSGTVGAARVGLDCDSQAGFALACDQPVVVRDWRAETRFRAPSLLRAHGVLGGVTVVIHGRDRPWGTEPWGVVGAHTASPGTFTAEDVSFLQAVGNTLALAIERSAAEEELRRRNVEIAQLSEEVSRLAGQRRRIMADALDAEDRTRERISQLLHDDVLQTLLTARQDLAKATRTGSAEDGAIAQPREAVVEAISELRNAVVALHPATLAQGGLAAAIKATAHVHARRGGFEVTLDVAPDASGIRDQLIVSLAQELLNNVARHAHASDVTITLRRTRDDIVFEVADDGRGMDPARPREAMERGHVGLASIAMRVESCGGRFELASDPGEGTRVRVVLPADLRADGPGR